MSVQIVYGILEVSSLGDVSVDRDQDVCIDVTVPSDYFTSDIDKSFYVSRPDWDALVAFVAGEHARLDKEKQA